MSTIFLTGITGTLGSRIAEMAAQNGDAVIGLIRKKTVYKGPIHSLIKLIEGDLLSDLSSVMVKADIIIHAAAETRQSKTRYSDYRKVNFEATVMLFQTALKVGAKKFVFISTANTIQSTMSRISELLPMPLVAPFDKQFYAMSKYEAEEYLYKQKHLMQILIVNPTFMIGATSTMRSSNSIINKAWKQSLIFFPSGGKNFVHIDEVAEFIVHHPDSGKCYEQRLLSGQNLTYRDFYKMFIKISKQRSWLVPIPLSFLRALGICGDLIRKLKVPTSLSSVNIKILTQNYFFFEHDDHQNTQRSIDAAIRGVINQLKQKSGNRSNSV